jgi:hypothetical protein
MRCLLASALLVGLPTAGCYDDTRIAPHDLATVDVADLATAPSDLACGCFCVTSAPQGNAVNLTAEGNVDWAHFGATMAPAPPTDPDDRKAGGSNDIGAVTFTGAAGDLMTYPNNGVPFSWTDGTPALTSPSGGSITGIKMIAMGDVLAGTVATSAAARTAKLFVDTFVTRARFEAWLDDGGTMVSPTFAEDVDNTDAAPGGTTREFQIRFCATKPTVQLVFRWTLSTIHVCPPAAPGCGVNAALQAVALAQ